MSMAARQSHGLTYEMGAPGTYSAYREAINIESEDNTECSKQSSTLAVHVLLT